MAACWTGSRACACHATFCATLVRQHWCVRTVAVRRSESGEPARAPGDSSPRAEAQAALSNNRFLGIFCLTVTTGILPVPPMRASVALGVVHAVLLASGASALAPLRSAARLLRRGRRVAEYVELTVEPAREGPPAQEVSVVDVTGHVRRLVEESRLRDGAVNVISKHTTTGVTINESEARLARDMAAWVLQVAPPDDRSAASAGAAGVRYEHNDIDERPESEAERERCRENGWNIDDAAILQKWRDQEPINAHSHLGVRTTLHAPLPPTIARRPCSSGRARRSPSSTASSNSASGSRSSLSTSTAPAGGASVSAPACALHSPLCLFRIASPLLARRRPTARLQLTGLILTVCSRPTTAKLVVCFLRGVAVAHHAAHAQI